MHRELNIDTVFDYIKKATTKYFDKITGHANPLMKNLKVSSSRHKNIQNSFKII